jgi:predicted ribosome quality control (RQC) complex YloA/Tae2 family protein
MHNNYYFLAPLAKALHLELKGMRLGSCFSQDKDELILGFYDKTREFWIKAALRPEVACLSFPTDFARKKRNSINLFTQAQDLSVQRVRIFENERAFAIYLAEGFTFVFKMYGRASNVLLFEGEEVCEIFQRKLENDWDESLSFDRPIDQSFAHFKAYGLQKTFPTFGKVLRAQLQLKSTDTQEEVWQKVQNLLPALAEPTFYISETEGELPLLTLFEQQPLLLQTQDPIEAANFFYRMYISRYAMQREQQALLKNLEKKRNQAQSYINKNSEKLQQLIHESRHEEIGHILMANLHAIQSHQKEVELFDFYRNQNIRIKLKPHISPQKNAENYYRKAKNQKLEVQKLKENIEQKERQTQKISTHIRKIQSIDSVREMRKYAKQYQLITTASQQSQEGLPFRVFEYGDFQIWVGKNAVNNDLLTQKYAYKEDLWLHARGVPGSHVVIKYRAGKDFPQPLIEKAAALAAYYSKLKNDSLCPVICTPKKNVRKRKGGLPGEVVLDKEDVLMVEPKAWES